MINAQQTEKQGPLPHAPYINPFTAYINPFTGKIFKESQCHSLAPSGSLTGLPKHTAPTPAPSPAGVSIEAMQMLCEEVGVPNSPPNQARAAVCTVKEVNGGKEFTGARNAVASSDISSESSPPLDHCMITSRPSIQFGKRRPKQKQKSTNGLPPLLTKEEAKEGENVDTTSDSGDGRSPPSLPAGWSKHVYETSLLGYYLRTDGFGQHHFPTETAWRQASASVESSGPISESSMPKIDSPLPDGWSKQVFEEKYFPSLRGVEYYLRVDGYSQYHFPTETGVGNKASATTTARPCNNSSDNSTADTRTTDNGKIGGQWQDIYGQWQTGSSTVLKEPKNIRKKTMRKNQRKKQAKKERKKEKEMTDITNHLGQASSGQAQGYEPSLTEGFIPSNPPKPKTTLALKSRSPMRARNGKGADAGKENGNGGGATVFAQCRVVGSNVNAGPSVTANTTTATGVPVMASASTSTSTSAPMAGATSHFKNDINKKAVSELADFFSGIQDRAKAKRQAAAADHNQTPAKRSKAEALAARFASPFMAPDYTKRPEVRCPEELKRRYEAADASRSASFVSLR